MPELLLQVVTLIATAGATYGALKADLRGLHERVGRVERSADQAHERLDAHIDKH